jgi:transglutaminase-like putative cysteine protease
MRLRVRHQTTYRYAKPIPYAVQSLRLTPRSFDGLAVISWRVAGETRRELPSFIDGLGNVVHCHSLNRAHRASSITVEGEVETSDTDGIVVGAPEPMPPLFFLRTTTLTEPDAAIAALAAGVADAPAQPLARLMRLMDEVRDRVDYRLGVTHVASTAAQALQAGAGVCQDHTHLFIAAARLLGHPARYVSGYLWAGANGAYEASHAWAEAHVEGIGWVGFDAANRTRPTAAYLRTAVGLDYWAAAPVRGVRRGDTEEALTVSVQVDQAAEQ